MAMTELGLLFIGALAVIGTYGLFYTFRDAWTNLLVEFGTAFLWGLFAYSSMDVIVRSTSFASASEPIMPLVILGVGMALLAFFYALYDLVEKLGQQASDVDLEGFGR